MKQSAAGPQATRGSLINAWPQSEISPENKRIV
jgi:hypothetical protein